MTCREKLQKEHPDLVDSAHGGGCHNCPYAYGYVKSSRCPSSGDCWSCWDREVEEDVETAESTETVKPDLIDICNKLVEARAVLLTGGFNSREAEEILLNLIEVFGKNEDVTISEVINILKKEITYETI